RKDQVFSVAPGQGYGQLKSFEALLLHLRSGSQPRNANKNPNEPDPLSEGGRTEDRDLRGHQVPTDDKGSNSNLSSPKKRSAESYRSCEYTHPRSASSQELMKLGQSEGSSPQWSSPERVAMDQVF